MGGRLALLAAGLLCLLLGGASAFQVPGPVKLPTAGARCLPLGLASNRRATPRGDGRRATAMLATTLKPKVSQPIVVEPVLQNDVKQIREVSTFFVDAFWKDYKAQALLTNDQKRRLGNEQYDDMRQRYGVYSPVPSALIVARDGEGGQILGCVGVEMALVYNNKIIPKTRDNLAQNYDMRPLLANLAVSPEARRRGLARDLCRACEDMVRDQWGASELLLLVEEENEPATKLYKKLGFREVWRDAEAKASMAVPYANTVALRTIRVTNVGMRKDLSRPAGLFGLGFMGL